MADRPAQSRDAAQGCRGPTIRAARFPAEKLLVATLFREYVDCLDEDLDFQGFEDELDALPGRYAEPSGTVLLAFDRAGPAGCVALRPIDATVAEMKRLWVRPSCRSAGVGRALALAVERFAVTAGYSAIVLDTLERLRAATRLYESLGYRRTEPYYHNPLEAPVFMRKELVEDETDV
jgi:GNAT superfamily N-acetyltransferase